MIGEFYNSENLKSSPHDNFSNMLALNIYEDKFR